MDFDWNSVVRLSIVQGGEKKFKFRRMLPLVY